MLDLAGRRALLFKAHQPDAGFERHACRNLAHFAAHGLQLRRKLGITIDKALKPAVSRVRKIAVVTPYYKEPDTELQRWSVFGSRRWLAITSSSRMASQIRWSSALVQPTSSSARRTATTAIRPVTSAAFLPSPLAMMRLPISTRTTGIVRHVDLLVRKQHETLAAAVCSWRNIYLQNGVKLPVIDEEDRLRRHVDTSCLMITRSTEYIAHLWGQMPQAWGPVCDRVVFSALADEPIAWSENRTLNFKSNYAHHYIKAGQPVPSSVHDIPSALWKSFATQDQAFRDLSKSRTGRTIGIHISRSHWEWLTDNRSMPRVVGALRQDKPCRQGFWSRRVSFVSGVDGDLSGTDL